jgi:hypothetical protein
MRRFWLHLESLAAVTIGLLVTTLAACGDDDDDYVYPSVVTTFVDLHTDGEGVAHTITTDEGRTWPIHPREGLGGLTPDSTYRMVIMYEPLEQDEEVQLYSAQKVISPYPKPIDEFKDVFTDPVELTSIWRGGDHLNLVVKAQVKDRQHTYHFMDLGISTDEADGHRTLQLALYHYRNEDVEAFSRTVYLSVPLQSYADTLRSGDSIRFSMNTYGEGVIARTFAW